MRPNVKKKLILAAATSTGLLGLVGYPAVKSVYPIKKQTMIVDDYVDLPTATADLTKDIIVPESVGAGTDIPVDLSHWHLLSLLNSKNVGRRERALLELARQRRWSDAECMEIAQAIDQQNMIRMARTMDTDARLFLPPPSVEFIEKTLRSNKIEKLVKTILKDVSENTDTCSSCTNFYTNLSIRVRPDSNVLAMNDLNQVDKMMRIESRKRKKSVYNEDLIKLKAILNNVICGERQASFMSQSGMLVALLYFRHKYKNDIQINGLLSQIIANLTVNDSTRHHVFTNGWLQILVEYSRSEHLELSLPAFKALANLDSQAVTSDGIYGNHVYLLSPVYRSQDESKFDIVFVHGLVGSVFKSWRQGSVILDEHGNRIDGDSGTPTTELLPSSPLESVREGTTIDQNVNPKISRTRCWPKDWLPDDIPGLRILALDYPTALSSWRTDCDLNKDTLRERAIHVMKQLEAAKLGDRPIIWVAHSMGGLLIKQILILCEEFLDKVIPEETKSSSNKQLKPHDSFYSSLLNQTMGIIFYSVPHKGSNLDWIERRNLQKLLMLTTEVIELQKGSPILLELHEKFLSLVNRHPKGIKFLTFVENSISSFGVNKVVQWRGLLVHEDSLQFEIGPNYKLNIDHAHTCKPHDRGAITYVKTVEFIKDLTSVSPKLEDEDFLKFVSFII